MDGIYRIFSLRHDATQTHRRQVGRIYIANGHLAILEDHLGHLHSMLPEGPVTPQVRQRLLNLNHSGYHQVVREDHIDEGHHPEHTPDLDMGDIEPEGVFTLTGEGIPAPQLVEVWGHAVMVAGKKLSDMETRDLMDKIHAGKYVLTPAE